MYSHHTSLCAMRPENDAQCGIMGCKERSNWILLRRTILEIILEEKEVDVVRGVSVRPVCELRGCSVSRRVVS